MLQLPTNEQTAPQPPDEPMTVRVVHDQPRGGCYRWLDNFRLCHLQAGHKGTCLPLPNALPKRAA